MPAQVSRPPTPDGRESSSLGDTVQSGLLPTTNYGAQVAYNYGSVSNYFCSSSDIAHQCHFPEILSSNDLHHERFYKKIEKARQLYKSKSWVSAKFLFYEVLRAPDATLDATERVLLQYNLAHTHFALDEFSDAASQFQDVLDIHQERNEIAEKSVSDSRYWLARSFYHLERHADASEEFQFFVLTHDQQGTDGAVQVTSARLWLGLTFERLGQYGLAKEQLSVAFETRVQKLGPEHLDTLACRHHLANFLYKRKAFIEAQEHFHALLLVEDNLSGPERGEAMRTRCMLAFCLAKLERYHEAEPHLERVLARMNSFAYLTDDGARDTGLVCYWLGRIALRKGNKRSVDQAENLLQRALRMISNFLGAPNQDEEENVTPSHDRGNSSRRSDGNDDDLQDELVGCRCYHAHAMRLQGHSVAAEQAYRQILDAKSVARQEYLIASRFGLATCLMERRNHLDAKSVLEDVVGVMTPLEGSLHTGEDLSACLHTLGKVYLHLEQYYEARDCFQRVVEAAPEKPNLYHSYSQLYLGIAMFELRQFEIAYSHIHKVYQSAVQNFGHTPLLFKAECWLSWSLCEVGRYSEAEVHLRPVFTLLPASPDRRPKPSENFWLGYSHYYQGRAALHRLNISEATKNLRLGQGRICRYEGLTSPIYLQCRYHLAYSLYKQNNYNEARQIFKELQQSENLVEPLPDIRLILAPYWLGCISTARGQHSEAEGHFAKCLDSLRGDTLPLHLAISTASVRWAHANSLYRMDRTDECCKIVRDILAELSQTSTENDDAELCRKSRRLLGHSLHEEEKFEEACDYLRSSVVELESRLGFDDVELSRSRAFLVDSLSEVGQHDEAAPHLARIGAVQPEATPGVGSVLAKAIASYWLGRRAFRRSRFGDKHAEGHFINAQKLLARYKTTRCKHLRIECQHFLARSQLREKKYADAGDLFRELARQQYESGDLAHAVDNQYWLGRSLFLQGLYTVAIPVFQKVASANEPGRVEKYAVAASHRSTGYCCLKQEKIKEAKAYFEMALQCPSLDSDTAQSRSYIAKCNFKLGMYEEARAQYQSCLDQAVSSSESVMLIRYWLGRTLFELGNWDQACIHLEIAALDESKSRLPRSDALEAHFYFGRARFSAGKYREALSPFLVVVNKYSGISSHTALLGHYYTSLTWYELGEFGASRRMLLELLAKYREKKPKSTKDILAVEFLSARCLVGLGSDIKAKAELERIVAIPWYKIEANWTDQTIMLAEYDLARIAYRAGDWSRALELLQVALLKHEAAQADSTLDMVQCQHYLAITLQELQRIEEATQLYRKVLESRTDETVQAPRQSLLDVQICLSRTLYHLDKRTGCEDVTQEAQDWPETLSGSTHPYSVRQQILLADLAFRLLDFAQAQELYAKVLALMEASGEARRMTPVPVAYLHTAYAVILFKLGWTEEARNHATTALEADCCHAHRCKSLDGFSEAFPELLASEPLSSAACSHSAYQPTTHITPTIRRPKHRHRPSVKKEESVPDSRASSVKLKQKKEPDGLTLPRDISQAQNPEQPSKSNEPSNHSKSPPNPAPLTPGLDGTGAKPFSEPHTSKQTRDSEQPENKGQSSYFETKYAATPEGQDGSRESSQAGSGQSSRSENGDAPSTTGASPAVCARKAPPRPKPKPAHLQHTCSARDLNGTTAPTTTAE